MVTFPPYVEEVNKRAKGELIIDYIGGPEVIDRLDQADAVRNGVIDISVLPSGYYRSLVPPAYSLPISQYTHSEERENGLYDLMVQEHAKVNIRFIGRDQTNVLFHFGLKERIERPQDLAGMRFRTGTLYDYFLTDLGVAPVWISHPEVYSSLERGVVDGYGFPFGNVTDLSLYEVVPYFIDHTFYESGNIVIIMNLDKWNSLPKHLQDVLLETLIDQESLIYKLWGDAQWGARDEMIEKGMIPITFSEADAKWFRDLAYSSLLRGVAEIVTPEMLAELEPLLIK